jgi:uncharacterized protein YbaP (TraB family)
MKIFKSLPMILLVGFFLVSFTVRAEETKDSKKQNISSKVMLWEITDGAKNKLYLMGSLHFGNNSLYPLDPTFTNAFNNSELLAMETSMSSEENRKASMLSLKKGIYQDKRSIADDLSPETVQKLKKYLKENGASLAQIAKMRPWLLTITLIFQKFSFLGYYNQQGFEYYFYKKASQRGMKVIGLETMEEHINLFADSTAKQQEFILLDLINTSNEEMKKKLIELYDVWKNGDVEKAAKLTQEDMGKIPELFKKVYLDRNVTMAAKISKLAKSDKKCFVLIGSGHLAGSGSVIEILEKEGFKVRQLKKHGKDI